MKIIFLTLMIASFLHSLETEKTDLQNKNRELTEKIKELEKLVQEQERVLKLKEYCDENTFPKLMMKQDYIENNKKDGI
jgi:hypothetical protein